MNKQTINNELLLSFKNNFALARFTEQEILEHLTIFAVL